MDSDVYMYAYIYIYIYIYMYMYIYAYMIYKSCRKYLSSGPTASRH